MPMLKPETLMKLLVLLRIMFRQAVLK